MYDRFSYKIIQNHTMYSRDNAKRFGLTRFNDGLPCKNGHYSDRYVISGGCIACKAVCSSTNLTTLSVQQDFILRNIAGSTYAMHPDDFAAVRQVAYESIVKKFSFLTQDNALSSSDPIPYYVDGYYKMFWLKHLPEDRMMLQELAFCLRKLNPEKKTK